VDHADKRQAGIGNEPAADRGGVAVPLIEAVTELQIRTCLEVLLFLGVMTTERC